MWNKLLLICNSDTKNNKIIKKELGKLLECNLDDKCYKDILRIIRNKPKHIQAKAIKLIQGNEENVYWEMNVCKVLMPCMMMIISTLVMYGRNISSFSIINSKIIGVVSSLIFAVIMMILVLYQEKFISLYERCGKKITNSKMVNLVDDYLQEDIYFTDMFGIFIMVQLIISLLPAVIVLKMNWVFYITPIISLSIIYKAILNIIKVNCITHYLYSGTIVENDSIEEDKLVIQKLTNWELPKLGKIDEIIIRYMENKLIGDNLCNNNMINTDRNNTEDIYKNNDYKHVSYSYNNDNEDHNSTEYRDNLYDDNNEYDNEYVNETIKDNKINFIMIKDTNSK